MAAGLTGETGGVGSASSGDEASGSVPRRAMPESPFPKRVGPYGLRAQGALIAGEKSAGGARLFGHRLNCKQRCRSVRHRAHRRPTSGKLNGQVEKAGRGDGKLCPIIHPVDDIAPQH